MRISDWSSDVCSSDLFKAAYGNHPYARPSEGTAQSLAAITRADLQAYVKRTFARDNMKIGVVGPITPAELGALLDKTFAALPAHAKIMSVPDVKMAAKGKTVIFKKPFPRSEENTSELKSLMRTSHTVF